MSEINYCKICLLICFIIALYNYFIILMHKRSYSFIYYLTDHVVYFYQGNCDVLRSSKCVRSVANVKYIAPNVMFIFLTFVQSLLICFITNIKLLY